MTARLIGSLGLTPPNSNRRSLPLAAARAAGGRPGHDAKVRTRRPRRGDVFAAADLDERQLVDDPTFSAANRQAVVVTLTTTELSAENAYGVAAWSIASTPAALIRQCPSKNRARMT